MLPGCRRGRRSPPSWTPLRRSRSTSWRCRRAGLTVPDLAALGVRRISLGSALARVAWGAFIRAAGEIAQDGRFDGLADAVPHADLDRFFRAGVTPRD